MFHRSKTTNYGNARQGTKRFLKWPGIIMVGMVAVCVVGCTPDIPVADPVKVLSLDVSPDSGITTASTATFYATGSGRVKVAWMNKVDTSGYKEVYSWFVPVEGEGEYSHTWNAGDTLTYFYQVVLCDSAGRELIRGNEGFFGPEWLPRVPPMGHFYASPSVGYAPLKVSFIYTDPGAINWIWTTYGDGSSYEGGSHTYTTPGTFEAIWTAKNPWGEDTDTVGPITIMNPAPIIDSFIVDTNSITGYTWFYIYSNAIDIGSIQTKYNIDAGDGETYRSSYIDDNPEQAFASILSGNYVAVLIINNDYGADTVSVEYTVP